MGDERRVLEAIQTEGERRQRGQPDGKQESDIRRSAHGR